MTLRHDKVEKIKVEAGLPGRSKITEYEYTCMDTLNEFGPNNAKETHRTM